jgi:hypothetical protein
MKKIHILLLTMLMAAAFVMPPQAQNDSELKAFDAIQKCVELSCGL